MNTNSGSYCSTPERIALREVIRGYWEGGWSARKISETLREDGHIMTRNACIGVISRMNLAKRATLSFTSRPIRPRMPPKPIEPVPDNFPPSLHLDMIEVSDATCRWPEGDGPFFFCGDAPHGKSVYCEFHHSVSRVVPHPARKDMALPE